MDLRDQAHPRGGSSSTVSTGNTADVHVLVKRIGTASEAAAPCATPNGRARERPAGPKRRPHLSAPAVPGIHLLTTRPRGSSVILIGNVEVGSCHHLSAATS